MNRAEPLVVFRCDASAAIGTGHLMRGLSLARALRQLGARCHFVVRAAGVDVAAPVHAAGFPCLMLPMAAPAAGQAAAAHAETAHAAWLGTSQAGDARDTLQALSDAQLAQPDWLVADHYAIDARWHRQMRAALGCRIVAIDDLGDRPLDVELLVDPNLHADHRVKYGAHLDPSARLLGGARFSLLGPAYVGLEPMQVRDEVASIGIFMGGSDPQDLSSMVWQACRRHAGFSGRIEIAATRANPHLERLQALTRQDRDTTLAVDLPDLCGFFTRHDLQIGAAGGATWERCCAGAPMVLIQAAGNQATVMREVAARDAAEVVATAGCDPAVAVGAAVRALLGNGLRRRELARHARALVDGLGACRVAAALLAPGVVLRPAGVRDSLRSFAWRNDPSTRRFSRDPQPIDPAAHERWWARAVHDPSRRLFIAHIGALDVGVLRLDLDSAGEKAEVSIYLDPALTGLGLGPQLLRALQHWTRAHTRLQRLLATILPDNAASMRIFAAAGFTPGEPHWTWPVDASA
ncbi:MAG: UDP-2,4-diacetamido-2,4, 6-trideoxy-beta-L-altropyranose hydrolase [Pseudomonadota bacterium]|jgi:UDP-2,4-diacetamido-2,4,6-trideoxy-beta-L-altropyranose hydrolase